MSKKGPILIIDDDEEDQEILTHIFEDLSVSNQLLFFYNGDEALSFLKATQVQPFLILSDVNMPGTNGIHLRRLITEDEQLRKKSIPFIFLSTSGNKYAVEQAYVMSVQGFFQKESSIAEIKGTLRLIIDYWSKCLHPNVGTNE